MSDGVVAEGATTSKSGNIVCDLDGVLYLEEQPIAGAGAALSALEGAGYRILLVTNNSTKTRATIAERVAAVTGYPARIDQVLSSAQAAATMLGGVSAAYVVGEQGLWDTLADEGVPTTADWSSADAVVVGLDREVHYDALRDAVRAVRNGARLVATNLDPTYPTPDGLWPGGGAIAAAIATGSGVEPDTAGKPYPAMRGLVRGALGPGDTWVVGDQVDTDMEMARLEGWTRVLVLTGVTRVAPDGDRRPEVVVESIADLPALLAG